MKTVEPVIAKLLL